MTDGSGEPPLVAGECWVPPVPLPSATGSASGGPPESCDGLGLVVRGLVARELILVDELPLQSVHMSSASELPEPRHCLPRARQVEHPAGHESPLDVLGQARLKLRERSGGRAARQGVDLRRGGLEHGSDLPDRDRRGRRGGAGVLLEAKAEAVRGDACAQAKLQERREEPVRAAAGEGPPLEAAFGGRA